MRYPRGAGRGAAEAPGLETVELGRGVVRREGRKIAILGFGTLLPAGQAAAEALDATVADMRFVKPIDRELILTWQAATTPWSRWKRPASWAAPAAPCWKC